MYLTFQHRDISGLPKIDFEFHLLRLRSVINFLAIKDVNLGGDWFLSGNSAGDTRKFPVFDGDFVRKSAIEELRKKTKIILMMPSSLAYGMGIHKKVAAPLSCSAWIMRYFPMILN